MILHFNTFDLLSYRLPKNAKIYEVLPFFKHLTTYYTTDGIEIQQKHLVRDLGVNISDDYSWKVQINTTIDAAQLMASWVLGVFEDRSRPVMMSLYNSLIRSKIEFCCALWNPAKIDPIQRIEAIQREFTRRIQGMSKLTYWQRLETLQILSLQRRRERYMIIHMWKIINGISPNDISIRTKIHSRLGIKIEIPPLNKKATRTALTAYENSFAIHGAKLWNILPPEVNQKMTLMPFKTALGKFMETIPDQPPTVGYSTVNSNSMIDWYYQRGGPQVV